MLTLHITKIHYLCGTFVNSEWNKNEITHDRYKFGCLQ